MRVVEQMHRWACVIFPAYFLVLCTNRPLSPLPPNLCICATSLGGRQGTFLSHASYQAYQVIKVQNGLVFIF